MGNQRLRAWLACMYADNNLQKLEESYSKVVDVARAAREFYIDEGTMDKFSDKDFTRMMFLDGCFVLQFIYHKRKALNIKASIAVCVRRDLYLLENQIPFQVLKELMKLKFNEESWLERFNNFIKKILGPPPLKLKGSQAHHQWITKFNDNQPHLLEIIRNLLVGTSPNKQPKHRRLGLSSSSYRSASDLNAVGIHFRPSKSRNFTDVTFKSMFFAGFLTLPQITVDDSTRSMLLNMVAYEASPCGPVDMSVSSYICFINSLIDHAEDVKLLRSKGILKNYLGSDQEVANIFNEIDDNLVPDMRAYAEVQNQIEKHYKNKIKTWLAEWFHAHFSSPWTVLPFLGAIFALVLSFIQTYVAVYPPPQK